MAEILNYIDKIANSCDLTIDEAARSFQIMLLGGANPSQIAAMLMGFKVKGESPSEITGASMAIKSRARKMHSPPGVMDICGTGNLNPGLLNISTTVSLVAAGAGVKIAKHGNKTTGSTSGSADVLASLGVNIDCEQELVEKSLAEAGICYINVPKFHRSMQNITPISQELGIRTILNLLYPLSNPANPEYHLIGTYNRKWSDALAQVLKNFGSKRAWIVHGLDGMDEITITGSTYITALEGEEITHFELVPEDLGIETQEDTTGLIGGEAEFNARAMIETLNSKSGIYRDIVLLNAAAAIKVAGIEDDLRIAKERAVDSIDSGKAKQVLGKFVEITNEKNS